MQVVYTAIINTVDVAADAGDNDTPSVDAASKSCVKCAVMKPETNCISVFKLKV